MGVLKDQGLEIQEFQFSELLPSSGNKGLETFELKSLKDVEQFKNGITEDDIRAEREAAERTSFNVLSEVAESRGMTRQAREDYERAVQEEVQRQLSQLRDQAYQEGLQKGQEEGREQAYSEGKQQVEEQLEAFVNQLAETQKQIDDILESSKLDAYNIIKNLTKWIVLKDVDEKYYLSRLLEKLIHEVNQKNNLVLHVNEQAFGYMPEIVKLVERKVGKLSNTRVEIDLDLQHNGIKLETENCIIDGSLDAQFEAIDELFKNVGLDNASKS